MLPWSLGAENQVRSSDRCCCVESQKWMAKMHHQRWTTHTNYNDHIQWCHRQFQIQPTVFKNPSCVPNHPCRLVCMGPLQHQDCLGMLYTYWQHQVSNKYGLEYYSLGAPALNDASKHHLLWVIGNICDKVINNTSEVAIWTSTNQGLRHAWV